MYGAVCYAETGYAEYLPLGSTPPTNDPITIDIADRGVYLKQNDTTVKLNQDNTIINL